MPACHLGSRGLSTQPIFPLQIRARASGLSCERGHTQEKRLRALSPQINVFINILDSYFQVIPIPKLDRWSDIGSGAEKAPTILHTSTDTSTSRTATSHIYRYSDK